MCIAITDFFRKRKANKVLQYVIACESELGVFKHINDEEELFKKTIISLLSIYGEKPYFG